MSKVFLDTNVLVYAMDENDPHKRMIARTLLAGLNHETRGVVSTQVMEEFYAVITRKKALAPVLAKALVQNLEHYEVVTITPTLVLKAIDCSIESQIAFWDALLIACAESAGCEAIITEDLSAGQVIRAVRVENPFAN